MTDVDSALAHSIAYQAMNDIWLLAEPWFWERRARQFEAARPGARAGAAEYTGRSTREDRTAAFRRLTAAAEACRNRGAFTEASQVAFDETLADLAAGAPPPTLDELEHRLRAAIDAGDTATIRQLEQLIDQLDPAQTPAAARPTTRRATAAA